MAKKKKHIYFLNQTKQRLSAAKFVLADMGVLNFRRDFIDKFTLCDLTCKVAIEYYKNSKGEYKPNEHAKLDMRIIPSAMYYLQIPIEKHILNSIFGGSGKYKKRGAKSAKKLRDGIVHGMNENDIKEVVSRYEELNKTMNEFLSFFE